MYPFQLDGHLITVVINAQVGDEGMYDLRVDGRCWDDLRLTTLEDLRARAKGGKPVTDSAWARGGAVAGVPADGAIYTGAATSDEAPEPVATLSMKDFVGSAPSKSGHASGADEFGMAAAEAGGAWDPFSGGSGAAGGASGGGFADFGAPAPAAADPWGAPAPAPAPAPALKKPTTSTTSATALKPPTGATASASHHRHAAAAPAAAAYDPFGDAPAAPAPAPAASGLADDFASLSFGSAPAPAAAGARRPSGQQAHAAAAADPFGMGGLSMGAAPARAAPAADPFGMGGLSMGSSGTGAGAAPGSGGGGLDDIFATPAVQPGARSAAGSSSRPGSAGGAHAPSLSGGLVDLDNLTASKRECPAPAPVLHTLCDRFSNLALTLSLAPFLMCSYACWAIWTHSGPAPWHRPCPA